MFNVLHESKISYSFTTIYGVRQGCLLCPLLLFIVMDAVSQCTNDDKARGIAVDPLRPNSRLNSLDYADDKCKLSHSLCVVQAKLDILSLEPSKVGFRKSASKIKELRVSSRSSDCVEELKY